MRSGRHRNAADETAAAYRYCNGIDVGAIVQNLEPDGTGSCNDVRMRVRRDEQRVTSGGVLLCTPFRLVIIGARAQLGARVSDGIDLRARRGRRRVDRQPQPRRSRGIRERASVVSGRRGDES